VPGSIETWLKGLGLSKYSALFADNEIGLDVLPDLSEADLKDLGIPLGDRKRLLKAVASLPDRPEEVALPEVSPAKSPEAERRQLTVMFCDLVGSTELAERLDPEDMRGVLRAYQEACAASVGRFEGHVAKYMGDGMLVYFGYPQAHEDDARRAVSAGLGIVEGVEGLSQRLGEGSDVELGVRVGIHTGLVVVGEMGGGGTREAEAIVGETPNVAARLEDLAEPNSVAISAATHGLVEGLFECDDLGPQRLKGVSEPVRVFRVLGESAAQSRFEAAAESGLTPLVGREEEIGLLLKRWQQAADGEGQVVLLSGEAGVGKSRILRAFRERLGTEPHSRVLYYGSAYHLNSALYPVIDQLERALRFARDDGPAEKLDKLEAALNGLGLPVADTAPILVSLLSLPFEGRYEPLELAPQQLKAKTLEASIAVIEAMAAQAPVLMVVEDVHWIDPSTVEYLDLAIERLSAARVLLIIIYRPEFEAPWTGHAHVTAHALNRLGRKDATAMVAKVTEGKALPDEVLDQIVAKTDGVPLYVEELTKTVLESGVLEDKDGAYVLTGPLPPLAIPDSLKDSLMARLDHLAPAKEVAQLAAVLGRTFGRELLDAVSPLGGAELDDVLGRLVESGLVYRRGLAPAVTYEFKHALVQDAAYQSLLKSTRQQYHGRIAQALEEEFPETGEMQLELLAHHYTEARLISQAIPYWQRAGRRAVERSANLEAIAHLTKGLELLLTSPDTPERAEQELALQIALTGPLIAARGYTAPETERTSARALELCKQIGDTPEIFPVLFGRQVFHLVSGRMAKAHQLAEEFLHLADGQQDDAPRLVGHRLHGLVSLCIGNLTAARRHLEQAVALYQPERHRSLIFLYGQDVKVAALSSLHWTLWLLGHPDQALERSQEALDQARALSHAYTLGYALGFIGIVDTLRRDWQGARRHTDSGLALAAEHGLPHWTGNALLTLGRTLAAQGRVADGIASMKEGLTTYRAHHAAVFVPMYLVWLAEAYGEAGTAEEGLKLLDEAEAVMETGGERWYEAEQHRIKGELLLARSARNRAKAAAAFRHAIEVARGQEAKSLELRAATSLARLWQTQKKTAEARDLLAPVYGWFTEGFDTADLKDAKALLDELS
jgi:class 3 adenylate cyclase/predicted ATPase